MCNIVPLLSTAPADRSIIPGMTQPSCDELERRFTRHGLPRRRLYPPMYRLYRWLGMRPKPPVLCSLADHFLYTGLPIAVVWMLGLVAWPQDGVANPWVYVPLLAMAVVFPVWNWWRARRVRRRIGLG